jgi:hypothetical protein
MGFVHREQPKISEVRIRALFMIVQSSPLTRSMLLPTQQRPQTAANKSVDQRELAALD